MDLSFWGFLVVHVGFFVLGYFCGRRDDIEEGYKIGYEDCKNDLENGYVADFEDNSIHSIN